MDTEQGLNERKEAFGGIAPFASGNMHRETRVGWETITSDEVPLGDFAIMHMFLQKPTDKAYAYARARGEDETGIAIDQHGNMIKGRLRDLFKQGFYETMVVFDQSEKPLNDSAYQKSRKGWTYTMRMHIPFETGDVDIEAPMEQTPEGFAASPIIEKEDQKLPVLLPDNIELLKAITVRAIASLEQPGR